MVAYEHRALRSRAFKGWNEQGIPTKETLRALGLDYVYEALEKKGVYSENGDAPSPAAQAGTDKEV